MTRDGRAALDGLVGGILATGAMSALMLAARRAGLTGELPPRRIAGRLLRGEGRKERNALAIAGHVGFGAAIGALFALLQRRLSPRRGAVPGGIGFATVVWFVSYQGWVPALRIMPPATRDRPGRPVTMLVAHWVYGETLGAFVAWRCRAAETPRDS